MPLNYSSDSSWPLGPCKFCGRKTDGRASFDGADEVPACFSCAFQAETRRSLGGPLLKPKRTWWSILGCREDAPKAVINACYRLKAKKAHPDLGGSVAAMQKLNAARDEALRVKSRDT